MTKLIHYAPICATLMFAVLLCASPAAAQDEAKPATAPESTPESAPTSEPETNKAACTCKDGEHNKDCKRCKGKGDKKGAHDKKAEHCKRCEGDGDEDEVKFGISGLYTAWGLNQRGFLLGKDNPLDEADYVVQMLRTRLELGKKRYGVVAQIDMAQGWWGADNAPNNQVGVTQAEDGAVTTGTTYNPYKLFRYKDTNYLIHVDQAYAFIDLPEGFFFPLRVTDGRQYFGVGNKLVLDQDYDGVIASSRLGDFKLEGLFAKISEGRGSTRTPSGALMSDDEANADANLFGGRVFFIQEKKVEVEAFGLFYQDLSGQDDYTYLPNGLGYNRARHTPQLSAVTALGVAAHAKLAVLAGLELDLEFDYLTGEDRVSNTDHAGGAIDINNGTLLGYNALLKAKQTVEVGVPIDLTLLAGLGSGDADPRRGEGNINKIQTMGFFPLTNVWEDSVMPDVAGISPQGLGSPVSRGYRELENTTALQARLGVKPLAPLRLEVSYTFLKATQPIHGFDASGTPTDTTSDDIGQEFDANLTYNLYKGVTYKALFGYFTPGEGAGLLINGNTDTLSDAWELKQVLVVKF